MESDTCAPCPIEVSPPSPLPPGPGGRPRRHPRLPKRYRDDPPATPMIVEPPVVKATPVVEHNSRETPPKWGTTEPNRHGLYKVLPNRPTHDPDETVSIDDLCKSSELLLAPKVPSLASATPPPMVSVLEFHGCEIDGLVSRRF
ncbi:hypothetical protein B0H19DRAFT_652284 [Mycena capillaripes]|nr:hypothetical protein B0H19DRAFT_652284 [Mycena capillaripes]